jgi:hypothetical protein
MSPQKPGNGTSVWANIVAEELAKAPALNGEQVIVTYNPGARDIAGFNKFHNKDRFNDNTIMVSHGGNAISYVQENVEYDYRQYDSVCHQNLNIIMAKRNDATDDTISHAAGSGMVPEALAIALYLGGPNKTVDESIELFKSRVGWVNGIPGPERFLAFQRGELTTTRANPAAYKNKVEPLIKEGTVSTWMHHGVLDLTTGKSKDDPNYPGYRFEEVYKAKWGVEPSGDLYDAYTMIHSWRDALQKALWVNKGNPNTAKYRLACEQMANNPESIAVFQKKVGNYDWVIGEDGNKTLDVLAGMTRTAPLEALVKFNTQALGLKSVLKPEMASDYVPVNTVVKDTKEESGILDTLKKLF